MSRVLITGMSGTGKSTVLGILADRGHAVVDTDYDGWTTDDGPLDVDRMTTLLRDVDTVCVSATADNQGHFYDRFEHVVLLSAPIEVLLTRVAERSTNPYGKSLEQQALIRRHLVEVEPLLRRGATLELDARRPPQELADEIERLLLSARAG